MKMNKARNVLPTTLAASVLLAIATQAGAASLAPGQSATVNAGDVPESWALHGATLTLNPGASSLEIHASAGSSVVMNQASVLANTATAVSGAGAALNIGSSVIRNTAGRALSVAWSCDSSGACRSGQAMITGSQLFGVGMGLTAAGGSTVTFDASRVEAVAGSGAAAYDSGVGFFLFGSANATIRNGSAVVGDKYGIGALFVGPDPYAGATGNIVIDNSVVQGLSGAAIYVESDQPGSPVLAGFTVQNGGQLFSGDGNALHVVGDHASVGLAIDNAQIQGNILNEGASAVDVSLRNGTRLTGSITNATSLGLADSEWQITADSSVGAMDLGNGTITFQAPAASTFSTLTVAGNYTGNGGTIQLNSALAGDNSSTNKLIVGGDSSGQTNVRVTNVGGAGAQTATGVEVVSVAGASNGQFDLQGRAIGGQYEYFLVKDGSNWYLRSQSSTPVDPCQANPSLPECGGTTPPVDPVTPPVVPPVVPILRPEPGAYLANLAAAQGMFNLGYHDRHAGQNSGRAWVRVDGSRNGFSAMSRQLDITGNSQSLTVGADLWRNENGSNAGVMLSSGNATSTSKSDLTRYYARGKVKGEALGIYGTLRYGNSADPYAGLYIDGSVQRAQFRNRVEGLALDPERYDTRAWQGALEAGYAFRLATSDSSSIYLEPQLQVGYSRWDSYRHTESNGTAVEANDADGMFGRVGMRLSGITRWSDSAAQVQPFLAVNWLHNRSEAEISMDSEVADARIPRTRAEVAAGASVKFSSRVGLWGSLSRQQGSGYHQTAVSVGMSYDW